MISKIRFILDTSVFVNPDSGRLFGNDPTSAFHQFLARASKTKGCEFYMPPRIYHELMHFADESKIPRSLLTVVRKKPPKKNELSIPAVFTYDLVASMRDRIDRGLRLAERVVRDAIQVTPPPPGPSREKRPDAELIGRLRESFRRIMREGQLDSKEDVDLLLLAYELKGRLVSADEGVLSWANELGIEIVRHPEFDEMLRKKTVS